MLGLKMLLGKVRETRARTAPAARWNSLRRCRNDLEAVPDVAQNKVPSSICVGLNRNVENCCREAKHVLSRQLSESSYQHVRGPKYGNVMQDVRRFPRDDGLQMGKMSTVWVKMVCGLIVKPAVA